jgi:hypothetical protein
MVHRGERRASMDAQRGCRWIGVVVGLVIGALLMLGQPVHAATPPPLLDRIQMAPHPTTKAGPPGSFPFRATMSADGLVVIDTYGRSTSFNQSVLSLVTGDLVHPIEDTLGFTLLHPVHIYIYNSRADFLAGAQPDNPAETGAYTIPADSTIYMPVEGDAPSDVQAYLPHELTHVVFHQNEDRGVYGETIFPLWVDEGNAAYDQVPGSDQVIAYDQVLQQAVSSNALIDLFTTFNAAYPSDPNTDFLGYAEARSFVGYLIATYSATTYHHYLRDIMNGDMLLAAEMDFGVDLRILESRWRVSLGATPTVADAGYIPTATTPVAFVSGTTPARAATTQPFPLPESFATLERYLAVVLWMLVEIAGIALIEVLRRSRSRMILAGGAPPRLRLSHVGIALMSPVALALGWGWVRYGPGGSWGCAALVVGSVAFVALLGVLAANWRRLLQRRLSAARGTAILVAAGITAVAFTQTIPLGWQQARDYEQHGAYALALQMYSTFGAPADQLATVHNEWANAAQAAQDAPTEAAQLRAEIPLLEAPAAQKVADALVNVIILWGQDLIAAHRFADAISVYTNQQSSATTCNATCQATMQQHLAATYLTWGDAQLVTGDMKDALANYQIIIQRYAATTTATTARGAVREIGAAQALAQALATGARGDASSMNAQLRALVRADAATAAASEAPESAEPVMGHVTDGSGAALAGQRIYFVAFTKQSDADSYNYNVAALTVAATIGSGNAFTVRLPAGYWYAPFWEDPTQPNSFNAPSGSSGVFFVQSYTPLALGTFGGF